MPNHSFCFGKKCTVTRCSTPQVLSHDLGATMYVFSIHVVLSGEDSLLFPLAGTSSRSSGHYLGIISSRIFVSINVCSHAVVEISRGLFHRIPSWRACIKNMSHKQRTRKGQPSKPYTPQKNHIVTVIYTPQCLGHPRKKAFTRDHGVHNPGTLPETNIAPENGWLEY